MSSVLVCVRQLRLTYRVHILTDAVKQTHFEIYGSLSASHQLGVNSKRKCDIYIRSQISKAKYTFQKLT